jgi:hypothetical protein
MALLVTAAVTAVAAVAIDAAMAAKKEMRRKKRIWALLDVEATRLRHRRILDTCDCTVVIQCERPTILPKRIKKGGDKWAELRDMWPTL